MSVSPNPYSPPPESAPPSADATVAPPRYLGRLTEISGELETAEAIALAKACKPISLPSIDQQPQASFRKSSLVAPTVVIVAVTGLFVLRLYRTGPALALSPAALIASLLLPLVFVILFAWMLYRRGNQYAACDPPLEGETVMRLGPLGAAFVKRTRDGRAIEIFCSWRQMQVTASDDAWLFNIGMTSPMLVAKRWLDRDQDVQAVEQLVLEITQWNTDHQPVWSLSEVPEEAMESFPSFPPESIRFEGDSLIELDRRQQLADRLRDELPEYSLGRSIWMRHSAWKALFWGVVALTAIRMAYDVYRQGLFFFQSWMLILLVAASIVCWTFYKISGAVHQRLAFAGALTESDLWLNYRLLMIRLPLGSFPYRNLVENTIVLGTATGSSVAVLADSYFKNRVDFQRAVDTVVPEASASLP
ncbi:hypothetical protein FYK55_08480 [Roseiconus nitratireducens]|uniref:Uncharacterized protein n=1 Tax=Roseiconus nitratireducens TaxID=2605748 RepID=A0A5M6DA16_9BACT|nr:hypothetical protein [Roseiconus nitratireducens]KAA5544374.1 hypothetical protein FYK55_08480 [Roseiconus nitratireducens]